MKRTALYEMHVKAGGKMIDFGGWELPVQYTGIIEEHEAVRNGAGLFDVSHMGEITVKGRDAEKSIQKVITNDISAMVDNQIIYSPVCYPDGGVVDDLLVYRFSKDNYLLVVNASNTEKDFGWLNDNLVGDVEIKNVSSEYAQLALQGPKSQMILQKLVCVNLENIKFFHFNTSVDIEGVNAIVSRTGYTGEDGFELYISFQDASIVWEKLISAGTEYGLVPVGLGARDTLRFESGLPLYGQEITKDISPLEAGLGMFVKFGKDDFIGKKALLEQKEMGLDRKLVGFEMLDRGIPRSHYDVESGEAMVGFVTTGGFSPTVKKNLGLALVNTDCAQEGTELSIVIRNKSLKAIVIKKPFYRKKYKKTI